MTIPDEIDEEGNEKNTLGSFCGGANTENRLPSNLFSLLLRIIVKQKKKISKKSYFIDLTNEFSLVGALSKM